MKTGTIIILSILGIAGLAAAKGYQEIKKIGQTGRIKVDASLRFKEDFPTMYTQLVKFKIFPRYVPFKKLIDMIQAKPGPARTLNEKRLASALKYFDIKLV